MSDEPNHEDTPEEAVELGALPLDSWHRARGARMVPFAGYEMPIQYEGIVAEHEWTRLSASLFDVSHMGQLTVHSPEDDPTLGARELEKLLPGLITSLKPGRMRYSMLLTEEGGVIDDLMVTNTGPHLGLVVNGACKWDDIAHLREHLADEVTLTHHDDFALLALQGPKAGEVLEALVPGTGALTFMTAGLFEYDGGHIWVSRAGYTGEDGFEISVHENSVEKLADALVADERVKPAGLGARDSLRLEAGLPLYGHDLTLDIDPVSADLTFALSKKRREGGGYMGHTRVMDALENGPATRRVGLKLEGRMPAREGAEVFAGDEKVGVVTSGGFSPTLGQPIAMAFVDAAHSEIGTELTCRVRNKSLSATVSPMPFVAHKYFRGN
ncbi:glycine cleavage system aminomethyltransferase GcvT [Qipengyuania sp. S6317L1]|uniref:glycine cleavage system aminomethyltransferase GcvT n=1 Tax=Qipengyuania sp. S6317L1 TaxID=2926410 RepID=UPI001FF52D23|nr:glycine cleavage system aminomethyltransferase GcvT [Qipengyuania sp. S6317L1]MCK0100005.1 glycine cleavage system aminomethyltransferase GcvT [Qipengyuania sp. S6317L1]